MADATPDPDYMVAPFTAYKMGTTQRFEVVERDVDYQVVRLRDRETGEIIGVDRDASTSAAPTGS